ncbi:uncharacterized protein LOC132258429 [Phlebotomus argentipes]|uniref:uncharacterized protein LOC132258429 n=1 Tax=Phlebotomus argentipes TaxID=94469 RepID=UPI0028931456|nr:uncharacterized protein LOC132258429 [Phlebotomus argentipes]
MFSAISECAKDWREVLEVVAQASVDERRKFSWIWPSEECVENLQRSLKTCGISCLLSIGCGSGLFEWIIQESCGIKVSGLELDNSWWTSPYAPATFIPLHFTVTPITADFLKKCAPNDRFALIFCYFNNGLAFWDYLEHFHGDFVIIAGPKAGVGIHTDPTPYALSTENAPKEKAWTLKTIIDVADGLNIIAIYERKRNP